MELRKEHSEGLARNPIEEKADQCANKTVGGEGSSVASIGIRIDPCTLTARTRFKIAHRFAKWNIALSDRRFPDSSLVGGQRGVAANFTVQLAPKRHGSTGVAG
jgi:hypothetical protein